MLDFLTLGVSNYYVWGLVFLRSAVSFLTFRLEFFLRLGVSVFLRFGVSDSYVWGLVFLRLGLSFLTFAGK